MKYIVYTVQGGYTFVICHDGKGGAKVKNKPSDDEVIIFTKEGAEKVVNNNPSVNYKIKALNDAL